MKVLMLKNVRASDNGYEVCDYLAGTEYEINTKSVVDYFLSIGAAKLAGDEAVVEESVEQAPAKKAVKKKPADLEDKMLDGSNYENKSAT